jgi:NTE family protein
VAEDEPLLIEMITGVESLKDREQSRYIHLVDGGITDNLGLHAIFDLFSLAGGLPQMLQTLNQKPPSHLMVISVNSSTDPKSKMSNSKEEPSIIETIKSMRNTQLHRYNSTTLDLMERSLNKWSKELSTPDRPVKSYFVRVGLRDMGESALQKIFNSIPTTFSLNKETIDHLTKGGQNILHNDPEFQRFVSDINGTVDADN